MNRYCLTLLLLCLFAFKARSQQISFSVKNASLEHVFSLIEKQSGYYFTYVKEELSNTRNVSMTVKNGLLIDVLELCFKDQPLTYEITGKFIIVKQKNVSTPGDQKLFSVTGKIADALTGLPMQGAIVYKNGTLSGAVADAEGVFYIDACTNNTQLTCSFIGYLPMTVSAKETDTLRIQMSPDHKSLDSVVINTGLYHRPTGNFTGAADVWSGEQLRNTNPTDVLKALELLDAGFRITENNVTGSDPNTLPVIQLRGQNNLPVTLQGNNPVPANIPSIIVQGDIMSSYVSNPNQPLIIIDGFQSTLQTLYDIDINRIERVTVLKDAAATVAYGSKAANGVLVVETKQPVSGKLQVSYAARVSLATPDISSYHMLDVQGILAAQQYAGIYTDPNNHANDIALKQWYDERLLQVQKGVGTDWLAQPVRNAWGTQHSVQAGGGNGPFRFAFGFGYNNQQGVMKGSDRVTYSLYNTIGYNAHKFKIVNSTSVVYMRSDNSPWGNFADYVKQFPFFSPYDSMGHPAKILEPSAQVLGIPIGAPGGIFANAGYNANIGVKDYASYWSFNSKTNAEWIFSSNLRLSAALNISIQLPEAHQYLPADHTSFLTSALTGFTDLGSYTKTTGKNTVTDGRLGLDYNKRMGDHTFFVTLGATAQQTSSSATGITVTGIPDNNLGSLGMANGYGTSALKPASFNTFTRSMSVYGGFSYGYKERYVAEVNGNAGGSSQFGKDNRIAPFIAYGVGWNIDKEPFFKRNNIIDKLRLRLTYGITGNQNFAAFLAQPIYAYNTTANYRLQPGASLQGYANPNLKWQQTNKWNIGLTAALISDRVNINGNFFVENTNNLILPLGVLPSTGFSTYEDNLGATRNTGYELAISANMVHNTKRDISWTLFFNAGHYANTIQRLSPAIIALNNANDAAGTNQTAPLPRYQVGQSMSVIWAVRSLGIDPATGNELFQRKDGSTTFMWSANDKQPLGDATSKVKGTVGSNFMYKGFILNIMMLFEYGGQLYNQTLVDKVENINLALTNADNRVLQSRWKHPGDNALFKSIALNNVATNVSARFIQNNNYINASSITIGYQFSTTSNFVRVLHLSGPRIFFTQNDVFRLGTVQNERGTDYPFARNYSLGFSTSF